MITSLKPMTPLNGTFTAKCDIPSVWEDGGKFCGTCNFTVSNNTGAATDGWTVSVTVPKGFEVTDSWNGVFKLNGTTLTVTNESYNGTVENGKTANFGFNFSSPKEVKSFVSIATNGGAPVIGLHQGNRRADNGSGNSRSAPRPR